MKDSQDSNQEKILINGFEYSRNHTEELIKTFREQNQDLPSDLLEETIANLQDNSENIQKAFDTLIRKLIFKIKLVGILKEFTFPLLFIFLSTFLFPDSQYNDWVYRISAILSCTNSIFLTLFINFYATRPISVKTLHRWSKERSNSSKASGSNPK